jgi:hypothetical protein
MNFRLTSIALIAFFTCLAVGANGQDSLLRSRTHKIDSAYNYQNKSLDSLQRNFHHRTDSLQKAYAGPLKSVQTRMAKLNHKKDSLNKLHLPTSGVTHELDSLQKANTAKLRELNGKIDKVKKETLSAVSDLHLPPEAQKEINALTKNIHSFTAPSLGTNFKVPGLNNNLSLSLPSNLSIPTSAIPSLQKLDINAVSRMPSLSQMSGPLAADIKRIQALGALKNKANAKALEQEVMNVASQNKEMKTIVQEKAKVTAMEKQMEGMKDPKKKLDSLALSQLKPATNHFLGKEKELQAAMGQLSKYKEKYSEVKSLTDLPRRPPNPLKGKPWYERVVPGVNYLILNKHYTMVDVNPYLGWRFNPKLTGYLGWNERIGVVKGSLHTNKFDRVFGVRGAVSYAWAHGFIFRLSPELMSAYIPYGTAPDAKDQKVVFGLYGGIRKDFKIYKGLSGYSEGVYNFVQKPGQNIYGDRLSLRLGLEMKIKKKEKKTNPAPQVKIPTDLNIKGGKKGQWPEQLGTPPEVEKIDWKKTDAQLADEIIKSSGYSEGKKRVAAVRYLVKSWCKKMRPKK